MGQGRGVKMGDWRTAGGEGDELTDIPHGTRVYPQHLWGQCQRLAHLRCG